MVSLLQYAQVRGLVCRSFFPAVVLPENLSHNFPCCRFFSSEDVAEGDGNVRARRFTQGFNLDGESVTLPDKPEEAPKPVDEPTPLVKHEYRQPAAFSDIPLAIRPQFRTPLRIRRDPVGVQEIFALVRKEAKANFNESVDVSIKLTIDPKKSNQVGTQDLRTHLCNA